MPIFINQESRRALASTAIHQLPIATGNQSQHVHVFHHFYEFNEGAGERIKAATWALTKFQFRVRILAWQKHLYLASSPILLNEYIAQMSKIPYSFIVIHRFKSFPYFAISTSFDWSSPIPGSSAATTTHHRQPTAIFWISYISPLTQPRWTIISFFNPSHFCPTHFPAPRFSPLH